MSKELTENCNLPSLEKAEKDEDLVPKGFPYLKRLLAEIDVLKERKRARPDESKQQEQKHEHHSNPTRRRSANVFPRHLG